MYNLLVSGDPEAWRGDPWFVEESRCAREYTENEIRMKFNKLDQEQINRICQMPSIFAYESIHQKNPLFGSIKDIVRRQGKVRIHYQTIELERFITHSDLLEMAFELDISVKGYELTRTHWAIKNVNLKKELIPKGIFLAPELLNQKDPEIVDITKHRFQVALSFPGGHRKYVESIARELEYLIGVNACFYDAKYTAQLARPSLDILLQNLYKNQSDLVVVFLCQSYQEKEWCGLEFRAIREIIKIKQTQKVMFVKLDYGKVEGVFETDGYIDAKQYTLGEVARFIKERAELATKQ